MTDNATHLEIEMNQTRKKLLLNKDTIKTLTSAQMNSVAGGGPFDYIAGTDCCPTGDPTSCQFCSGGGCETENPSGASVCLCSGGPTC